MERYVCIHGHFYQPPRENPWLETIELQDSAGPYHDWNERIEAECYRPNAASRILDQAGLIAQIVCNYAKISFNFGPTLLSWMEEKAPETYQAILEADFESQRTFSGHGSALAQAYSHMILPLANRRDKATQIVWGIRDFERRFRRHPEGLWLPETAVDIESLDMAAAQGIRFTILAPDQARRVRKRGDRTWHDVTGGRIDSTMAYMLRLPSQREIAIFFYDALVSRAVAFEHLLSNGVYFAGRLLGAFSDARPGPQLAHIATDGETYGHHHRFGDMALAYALHHIESNKLGRLTNYGEFLERHPPAYEVEIIENTSWSCPHGIERWRSNCGCNTGQHAGWKQDWRTPLRASLDWLRDTLAPLYEQQAGQLLRDPWGARDTYIGLVLDREPEQIAQFLAQHALHELDRTETTRALKLLELQRHAMLMYTSCGWFFDDISGIETVQILQYAGRAIQLGQGLFQRDLETQFLALLEQAKSNVPTQQDGRRIYDRAVKPAMISLERVGAHYAISSLFAENHSQERVACYEVEREDFLIRETGKARFALGRARITCRTTLDAAVFSFAAIHFGDHNITCGIRPFPEPESYRAMVREISDAFTRGDLPEVVRLMDRHFGAAVYSLRSLFRDEQRRILGMILENALTDAESVYRHLYDDQAPLMRFVTGLGIPQPKAFRTAAEFVLNADLRRAFAREDLDLHRINVLIEEVRSTDVALDTTALGFVLKDTLEKLSESLFENPSDLSLLQRLSATAALIHTQQFAVDLRKIQNTFCEMRQWVYPDARQRMSQGDEEARAWVESFVSLGASLGVKLP